MIKVVIADDEAKVCQLICGLIDWKSIDMEIVGVAHNGIEALELIKNHGPDLVITDIRMPGYDGLEIIHRGKQINKDMEFVIISGYSHFEYAQSAIKYGVSDYLLKPINKKELLNTLNKIHKNYKQRTQQLSREEQLKLRLQNNIDKLRSGFFTEILLSKDISQIKIDINKINEDYQFNFKQGYFQAFIVKVDCEYQDMYEGCLNILKEKINQVLWHHLEHECFDLEIYSKNSRAYCILNYDKNNQKILRKKLRASLDEILVQKSLFEKIQFTMGLGIPVEHIEQIQQSMATAKWAIGQRLIEGTGKLLEGKELKDTSASWETLMPDLAKKMENSLEVLDVKGVMDVLDSLKDHVLNTLDLSGQEMLHLVKDVYNIYLMLLRKHRLNMDNFEDLYKNFSLYVDLCSSAPELFELLSKVVGDSLDIIVEEKKRADIKPILMAKQYIKQNYMNPITLKEVSSFVGFNDSYFSSLFKKEDGQNFSEYLLAVRMDKAKDLLKQTDLRIDCICEMVGYTDLRHFTRNFKKNTGLTPNEYRKLYI